MIDAREADLLDTQPPLSIEGLEKYAEGTASQVCVTARPRECPGMFLAPPFFADTGVLQGGAQGLGLLLAMDMVPIQYLPSFS
jgi:hypothetical protein